MKKNYITKQKLINMIGETFQFLENAGNLILSKELDEMDIFIPGEGRRKLRTFKRNEELKKLTRDKLKSLNNSLRTRIWMDQISHPERWQSYYEMLKEREFKKDVEDFLRKYPDAHCNNSSVFNENLLKKIDELGLSIRTCHCLRSININTVADLVQKTEEDLYASKNIGRKSLYQVKVVLYAMGLRFGMTIDAEK